MSLPASAKYIFIMVLAVLAAVNFTRTTLNVIESSKRLEDLKVEVSAMEQEKTGLEEELAFKESDEFIELEARNKLGMVRDGEELYVVNEVLGADSASSDSYEGALSRLKKSTNAQLWLELFF